MDRAVQDYFLEASQGAFLSDCENYRYALWRTWDSCRETVFFIGLNPSTADATMDDPTLRRCIHFAQDWGFGGLLLGNLFAWRSKSPGELTKTHDPIGPDTDDWLELMHCQAKISIAVWGNLGRLSRRGDKIYQRFADLYCLGLTRFGQPRHPLYLKSDTNYCLWK